MAKFKLNALRKLHSDLGSILSDYDEAKAAETAAAGEGTASDNEQPEGGTRAPAAATNSGSALDSLLRPRQYAPGEYVREKYPNLFGK
jgi:hypothetical protein